MRDIIGFLFIIPAVIIIIVYGFIMLFWLFFFGWIPILIGKRSKQYVMNLAVSIDQLGNVVMGGDPDETISSRLGKNYPKISKVIDFIFFWQKEHCKNAIEKDEGSDSIIE